MDGLGGWFAEHWFDLIQSLGIAGGLVFTGVSARWEARAHRADSLVRLTDAHRQLWLEMCQRAELRRVLRPEADLERDPLTFVEEEFVNLFIVHLATAWDLVRSSGVLRLEAVVRDVRSFFGGQWGQTLTFDIPCRRRPAGCVRGGFVSARRQNRQGPLGGLVDLDSIRSERWQGKGSRS